MAKTNEDIIINFEEKDFRLNPDAFDFGELLNYVVNHQDEDYSKMTVEYKDDAFDIDAFKAALIEEIYDFIKQITIENNDLKSFLEEATVDESIDGKEFL